MCFVCIYVACTCIHGSADRTLEETGVSRHRKSRQEKVCGYLGPQWPRGMCGQELGFGDERSRDRGERISTEG